MQMYIKSLGRELHKTTHSHLKLNQCYDLAVKQLNLAETFQQFLNKPELVNPIFLVEVELRPTYLFYRLQFDGSWRNITGNLNYMDGDYFTAIHERLALLKGKIKSESLILDGEEHIFPEPNAGYRLGDKHLSFKTRVIFKTVPQLTPDPQQLREVIASTEDKGVNVLSLDIYGKFLIKPFHEFQQSANDKIVYRHEAFSARGYLGEEASNDDDYMDELYLSAFSSWVNFVKNGNTNHYVDYPTTTLLKDLKAQHAKLRAAYKLNF